MAGAGTKAWSTGDVVTAAQFNTYLQEQVIAVFADNSARDAAYGGTGEPTLAEGMACYVKDSNTFQIYSGSGWVQLLDLDSLSVTGGNYTILGDLTVGVDDEGKDVTFYGDTSAKYLQWDESADELELSSYSAPANIRLAALSAALPFAFKMDCDTVNSFWTISSSLLTP